jgi:hypothetical protein
MVRDRLEVGQLLPAGYTPGRPDVEQDDVPTQVGQGHGVTGQSGGRVVGAGSAVRMVRAQDVDTLAVEPCQGEARAGGIQ